MNVRDFLFNFCRANVKICIQTIAKEQKEQIEQILFYGKAAEIDRVEILNRMVVCVHFDIKAECLILSVRNSASGATYHLPEDLDYVY